MNHEGTKDTKEEIRFIDLHLAVATLKPGDRLVLSYPLHLPCAVIDQLKKQMAEWAPGVPVIVLDAGLKLGVVSSS